MKDKEDTVYAIKLLHKLLTDSCPDIHQKRHSSLLVGVAALLQGDKLTVTGLGRSVASQVAQKHTIKRMDRLVGNKKLHEERTAVYQCLSQWYLANNKRPIILVDGSGLSHCGKFHLLRASVVARGRAMTLYEEALSESEKEHPNTHNAFLERLATMVPSACRPIVITDAGFRNPWFKKVEKMGWHWIGRVRNRTHYKGLNEPAWKDCKSLYDLACQKAQCIGNVTLTKTNPLRCYFYLHKQEKQYRTHINLRGHKVRCSSSLKHAKRGNEPWLIASSLSPEEISAKEIMKLYGKRMQIEEAFRDIKNRCNGFSLRESRTNNKERFNILLLIGNLATLALWLVGLAAEFLGFERDYQANTVRNRKVLSVVYLGKLVLRDRPGCLRKPDILRAAASLQMMMEAS